MRHVSYKKGMQRILSPFYHPTFGFPPPYPQCVIEDGRCAGHKKMGSGGGWLGLGQCLGVGRWRTFWLGGCRRGVGGGQGGGQGCIQCKFQSVSIFGVSSFLTLIIQYTIQYSFGRLRKEDTPKMDRIVRVGPSHCEWGSGKGRRTSRGRP